jgi:hypothetical protein
MFRRRIEAYGSEVGDGTEDGVKIMLNRRSVLAAISALPFMAKGASAKLREGHEIVRSFDASDWARDFVAHVKANPSIATDEGTMIGWFANAIMRGYDEHARIYRISAAGAVTSEAHLRETVGQAVARGWCADANRHKEMDPDLAMAIVDEVVKLRA